MKTERISIRCTKKEKDQIKKNAGKEGSSRYLVRLGLKNADKSLSQMDISDRVEGVDVLNEIYHVVSKSGDEALMKAVGDIISQNEKRFRERRG